jgi:HSP20 family protein
MDHTLDRMWGGFFRPAHRVRRWRDEWELPLDVYQTDDSIELNASVPGIKPEDVEVTIEGNTLTLKGDSKSAEEKTGQDVLLRERRYGSFCRSVKLPEGLDTGKAEAVYENGVLTLSIPKREETKPKSIKVKVAKAIEAEKK